MTIKSAGYSSLLLLALGQPAQAALESLSEGEMQAVSGQDGIEINLSSPGTFADAITWRMDTGQLYGTGTTFQSNFTFDDAYLRNVALDGTSPGVGNLTANARLDVGSDALTAGNQYVQLDADWNRMRFEVVNGRVGSSTNSLGSWALDTQGSFRLSNRNSLLNASGAFSNLRLEIVDGNLWYRQGAAGSAEMLMNNFDFLWEVTNGTVGADATGLVVSGDVNFNLTFDLRFEAAPSAPTAYTVSASDLQLLRYGWSGGLTNAEFRMKPGGAWRATPTTGGAAPGELYDRTTRTQGITTSVRWDYQSNYYWLVGEAGGNQTALRFGNWQKLPAGGGGSSYAFELPTVVLDVINNASQGPGGLCWGANWEGPKTSCEAAVHGGQFIEVGPENNGIAWLLRDGALRAYSSNVTLIDQPNPDDVFNWGLVYTLGNIDGNIYIYPGGPSGATTGMKVDLVLMSQTFDFSDSDSDGNTFELGPNWSQGGHLMIADTDANMGIGFVNSSFLVAANDLYVVLRNTATTGIALQTTQGRIAFKGRFGGGDLPNRLEPVNGFDLNANLEFDNFQFIIAPPASGNYLGYEATVNLANTNIANFSESTAGDSTDDGSFISLAEPSKPTVDIRFADLRGTLRFRNGKIDLLGDAETLVGPARLSIENNIDIGPSAGGTALVANRVELGNRNLGSMVIPDGQWYSRFELAPKN